MNPQKILVIKHGALGDIALALGTMKEIRRRHPEAQIDVLTMSSFASFLEGSQIFDHVIIDNRPSWQLGQWYKTCFRVLARSGYEIIIDLQANNRTRFRYFSLARLFSPKTLRWAHLPEQGGILRTVEKKCALSWGTLSTSPFPLEWQQSDLSFIQGKGEHFSLLPDKYVLLIPGSSPQHPYKRWPVAFFKQLVAKLAQNGIYSVILGTQAEAQEVEEIAQSHPYGISFLGKSSLLDIPTIAQRALATVGNDTGPTHIASLCHQPTIGLYPEKNKASRLKGNQSETLLAPTLEEISVDKVWQTLKGFLPELSV